MDNCLFEKLSASFVSCVAQALPGHMRLLVFASPLSARSPDLCMLWHDGYREKHRIKLMWDLLAKNFCSFLKGTVKLVINIKPLKYAVYGKVNSSILVVASTCGFEDSNGAYKTTYVHTEDEGLFVFGPIKTCGKGENDIEELALKYKLLFALHLMRSGIHAFIKVNGNLFDKTLIMLKWTVWVVSLQWVYVYYLEHSLSEVVKKYTITKIGCIHEMHFYARVVWQVASKYNARGYTVQHAAITQGKRWYFAHPDEKKAGLILPDVMYVYNEKVIQLLKPYFENTKFLLGCSCRYSFWKETKEVKDTTKRKYFLFVGALAQFDNDVLIDSLRNLLNTTKESVPIRLRFHPDAKISYRGKNWFHSKTKKGIVEISKNTPLKTDIEGAIAVIGMSTTVLEEALLMGCPVIQLTHPDYLQYIDIDGVPGAVKIDYRKLSVTDLLNMPNVHVDSESMRKSLGLNHPVVNYKQLFSKA